MKALLCFSGFSRPVIVRGAVGRLKHEDGFSLVEVLVTISIIVTLAALLMPAYRSMQERSRSQTCLANLRQIHAATVLYGGENFGALPDYTSYDTWCRVIWPYLYASPYVAFSGNSVPLQNTVFCCPSAKDQSNPEPRRSYGINVHLIDNNIDTATRLVQVEAPTKSALYGDSLMTSSLNRTSIARERHQKKFNCVFVDGHVESTLASEDILNDALYTNVFWRGKNASN